MVYLERVGTKAALTVRDTGVGIAPEVLQHLFEPFAQAPQTMDRTRGGLGLGLAMVKGLVELHGGTVSISSDGPHRGASIRILLPLAEGPARAANDVEPPSARGRRVLVIEDNRDAADTLSDTLTLQGHHVEVAYDGPSGIAAARRFAPDVVICDIGLPQMDGYEVAQQLRADEALRSSYLIALSGYAAPEDVERARTAGFDRHAAKPLSIVVLDRLISEAPASGTYVRQAAS